jgi:asparagine synthase (glutamine-hydrolysing)
MCGIVGYLTATSANVDTRRNVLQKMCDAIKFRGPDSEGIWLSNDTGIGLGHRRLSILDLSPAGHQPMVSASGRFVIAFNGEIYNHLDLRTGLEKISAAGAVDWQGHSDTETLIVGIEAWGLEETLRKSVGMFAFALWDREERELYLARDRMGEKPLYYGYQQGDFLFGSELKALKAHPAFEGEVDRNVITLQLRHNCIPTPYSIYKGIRKLPPGTFLSLSARGGRFAARELPEPMTYWSLEDATIRGLESPFDGSDTDAIDALDHLLRDSVKQQMVADVPLGAFLSGGVDSSTITALMQSQSSRPVKTFSIGFNQAGYNEAVYAKAVARYLGTDHTELYVSPQQAMDVIPRLPSLYDEPFSDSSQIPTFLVSQMTREHVTVSLSGDAGDELFGGYNRYLLAHRLWGKLSRLPSRMRRWGVSALTALSPDQWDRILGPIQRFMPEIWRLANLGDKLHKGAGVVGCNSLEALYLGLVSHWDNPSSLVIGGNEPGTLLTVPNPPFSGLGGIERMMARDALTYLPDDILVKVDRAAMSVSLETRIPFLDHRVAEFAWRLPLSMKIRSGQGKWILRQVLYKYVPKELIERPKMGFGVPIDSWLRGPLRDWAESLLDESRLRNEGFFKPAPIRQKWAEHLSGQRNWQYQLWDVLMFQAWLEKE